MAIRLASAIGQQREPTSILSGVDDAINRTGDAIQAANREKRNEEAKKRDAALQAAINIDTNIDAMKDDNEKYKQTANKLVSEVFTLYANGASPMQIAAKKKEAEEILAPMKYRYEKDKEDYSKIQEFVSKEENKGKYDFTEAENFLLGRDTREVPMPMQAPTDRAMPLNKEDSDVTEVMNIQETPYWKKDLAERQTQAPSSAYSEFMSRVKDITGNFKDASKGVFGSDYNPQQQYSKVFTTQNADGTTVQEVRLDTEEAARDKSKFLSTIGTDLGDTKTQQYWRTLANKAGAAGKRAGYYGEKLNKFVKEQVINQASTDWDNAIQQDIEKTKISKVDKAPFREGKGMVINNGSGMFSNGNTSMNKTEEITPYVQRKYAAKELQIRNNIERLKNSTNPTDQQTVKGYEKSLSDLERLKASEAKDHIKYSNAKAKDDQYVTYGVVSGKDKNGKDIKENISFRPEDFFERNGKWYMAGQEKKEGLDRKKNKVVTYLDREIPLDENNYKKLITEDKLVIPLLEKYGIKASGQKQSGAEVPKATADASSNYQANKKAYMEEFGLKESDLTEEDINYLKSK